MLIKRLIPYFIAVGLILPAFAFSQTEEIKDYKVQERRHSLGHIKQRTAGSFLMA